MVFRFPSRQPYIACILKTQVKVYNLFGGGHVGLGLMMASSHTPPLERQSPLDTQYPTPLLFFFLGHIVFISSPEKSSSSSHCAYIYLYVCSSGYGTLRLFYFSLLILRGFLFLFLFFFFISICRSGKMARPCPVLAAIKTFGKTCNFLV